MPRLSAVGDDRSVAGALQRDLEERDVLMQVALAEVFPGAPVLRQHDHLHVKFQQLLKHARIEEGAIILVARKNGIVEYDAAGLLFHRARE